MATIEIWGPEIHLADLLDRLPTIDQLHWAVLEMWAVGRDDNIDIVAIEQRARDSPAGLAMSPSEIRKLATGLRQLIDAIVVGYRGDPPSRSDPDLRVTADVVIEAIDSTLWRIYARDQATIQRLRREYQDVRDVVPEVAIPGIHARS
jgi:hypothetical protein